MKKVSSEKRSYGTGGLRQENGSWVGSWHSDGRRVRKSLGRIRKPGERHGLTRKQAEGRLRGEIESHEPSDGKGIGFADAAERYISSREMLGRKATTVSDYRSHVRIHLEPEFGDRPIRSIKRSDLERFRNRLLSEPNGQTGRPLASKSVCNLMILLNAIFVFCDKELWLDANPMKGVDRPKNQQSKEIRFLSMDEIDRLETEIPDDYLGAMERVMYRFAAETGLRQGEILGLRWMDVDWLAARVRVRRSVARDGEITTPKSERGSRAVPLSDEIAVDLEKHFRRSKWQGDGDLVFCHPLTGKPYDRSKLLKRFKAALLRAGVGETETRIRKGGVRVEASILTFHSLRHTFGTLMARAGTPMRELQEWMGHSDYMTTLIYADYAPSGRDRALVNSAFSRQSDSVPILFQKEREQAGADETERDEKHVSKPTGSQW